MSPARAVAVRPYRRFRRPSTPSPARPRDWFLRRSRWQDPHWILAATSTLDVDRPVIIRWDFPLPNGLRLTDSRYAALLESAKQHLVLFRTGSTHSGASRTGTTIRLYFQCLRALIRWMISEGLERFSELDAAHITQFTRVVRRRRGYAGPTLSPTSLRHYYGILVGLYRHRRAVSDAIQVDPFPGLTAPAATPLRTYKPKATL